MSDLSILREKKPEVAEFVQQWQSKYQRTFNLNEPAEQANFYEAMVEMARHVANGSTRVDISLLVSNEGVNGLRLTACSKH